MAILTRYSRCSSVAAEVAAEEWVEWAVALTSDSTFEAYSVNKCIGSILVTFHHTL